MLKRTGRVTWWKLRICCERASRRTWTLGPLEVAEFCREYHEERGGADCRSCYDTLQKPVAKTAHKRLGIELASLRQSEWKSSDSGKPNRSFHAEVSVGSTTAATCEGGLAQLTFQEVLAEGNVKRKGCQWVHERCNAGAQDGYGHADRYDDRLLLLVQLQLQHSADEKDPLS